ncbi:MAG: right-handed parallel beta-helix repeat-containing protein [Candidatus Thorarchaeota archaeon]
MHTRISIPYLLVVIMIFTLAISLSGGEKTDIRPDTLPTPENTDTKNALAYTTHTPITITSNADFVSQGWLGSGTVSDPYRIENLSISSSSQTRIEIRSTTVYFVIRNCYITNSSGTDYTYYGIYLHDNDHGAIEDCIIDVQNQGIYLNNNNDTSVTNTTITSPIYGIHTALSYDLYIHNCTISEVQYAININNHENVTIDNSTISTKNYMGIKATACNNVTVSGNLFTGTGTQTIYIATSNTWNITSNKITTAGSTGIYMNTVNSSYVTNNLIANASSYCISITGAYNISLAHNTLYGMATGIYVKQSHTISIDTTIITGCKAEGLYVQNSYDYSLTNSVFESCGVYLDDTNLDHLVLQENNNTINGKKLGYFLNRTNVLVDGTKYGQIIIVNSTGTKVFGGTFYNASMLVTHSNFTRLTSCTFRDYYLVHQIKYSSNVTINNCTISNSATSALSIDHSDNCTIMNSVIRDSKVHGVYISYSEHMYFLNNTVESIPQYSVYAEYSPDSRFVNNTVSNSDTSGITVLASNRTLIEGNSAIATKYGIYLYISTNVSITNNLVTECSDYGIITNGAFDVSVRDNVAITNRYGIYVSSSNNATLTNNAVIKNNITGIVVLSTSNATFVENVISKNPINAQDNGTNNAWDDGVSKGNSWSDYNGTGNYSVPGSAGSIDHYPSGVTRPIPPEVEGPATASIIEDSTGNTILWNARSFSPSHYIIKRNNTVVTSENWDGSNISYSTDGLELGTYNFTITVYDSFGFTNTTFVIVTVADQTAPVVDHPQDAFIEAGSTGNEVIWAASDHHPASYSIFRNGVHIASGTWTNAETVRVSADGLDLGTYNFTVLITDESGNQAVDSVFITVRDTTAPTITTPEDIVYVIGTRGHVIHWNITDLYSENYKIFRNGTLVMSGQWVGSAEINVDYLMAGTYNFTIVAYDSSGNMVSDTVIVTVSPAQSTTTTTTTTSTTTPPTLPNELMVPAWMLGLVIGIMSVVIIVIVVIMKRQ